MRLRPSEWSYFLRFSTGAPFFFFFMDLSSSIESIYQVSLPSSGMTFFIAAMAHSIMLSSGSNTVRC